MIRHLIIAAAFWLTCIVAGHAFGHTIRIIDGDTLVINGEVIRLHGVDAPERGFPGYHEAAAALRSLAADGVTCEPTKQRQDHYGRTVARCYVGNRVDVGCEMIRQGHAVEVLKYSKGGYENCN